MAVVRSKRFSVCDEKRCSMALRCFDGVTHTGRSLLPSFALHASALTMNLMNSIFGLQLHDRWLRCLMLCLLWLPVTSGFVRADAPSAVTERDVVIYGGTAAAITAAVQAKRMGRSVVVVSPDKHLGGMTSGGLGWTDSGKKEVIGGLAKEFYQRVYQHYRQPSAWTEQTRDEYGKRAMGDPAVAESDRAMYVFEPHVAEGLIERWVREHDIEVVREALLDRSEQGVRLQGNRIDSIKDLDGRIYRGAMFIDATYEGDLVATAGVSTTFGREANSQYDEVYNGNQVGVLHHAHFFATPIDPYVVPGDPSSGLLPRIGNSPPGVRGEADHRIQAYCFRMCMTNDASNRLPFPKPEGYDASQYELALRVYQSGWDRLTKKFDPLPNHKTDTNNHGPFSTDNIGMNHDYPEADYARRREIVAEHETYQKGLMWFIANDPRVPSQVREDIQDWGLAADEFTDNGGWPHQLYIREARRMVGQYVMTEHDCLDRRETPQSVGMGSYTLDSHNVRRYVTDMGHVQNEGDIGVKVPVPYEIAYGSLIPKASECTNLLVPVCVSSSHIAYGSIRMEPVFMILGQSAATAAVMAIENDQAVQDVPYERLRERLVADGQVLRWEGPRPTMATDLLGVVLDDVQAEMAGGWTGSQGSKPFIGAGYHHNNEQSKSTAIFRPGLDQPGEFEVRVSYTPHPNRSHAVTYRIETMKGTVEKVIDQTKPAPLQHSMVTLGVHPLDSSTTVTIQGDDSGYTIVDAIQLLPVVTTPPPIPR